MVPRLAIYGLAEEDSEERGLGAVEEEEEAVREADEEEVGKEVGERTMAEAVLIRRSRIQLHRETAMAMETEMEMAAEVEMTAPFPFSPKMSRQRANPMDSTKGVLKKARLPLRRKFSTFPSTVKRCPAHIWEIEEVAKTRKSETMPTSSISAREKL
jgi:hypothetical protein